MTASTLVSFPACCISAELRAVSFRSGFCLLMSFLYYYSTAQQLAAISMNEHRCFDRGCRSWHVGPPPRRQLEPPPRYPPRLHQTSTKTAPRWTLLEMRRSCHWLNLVEALPLHHRAQSRQRHPRKPLGREILFFYDYPCCHGHLWSHCRLDSRLSWESLASFCLTPKHLNGSFGQRQSEGYSLNCGESAKRSDFFLI